MVNKTITTFLFVLTIFSCNVAAKESTCFGTTSAGRLEHGVQLPDEGNNYVGYSSIARLAGRTYVHSKVRDIVVDAYVDLEIMQPEKIYKYAETGFEEGGKFKPHKTVTLRQDSAH